MDNKGQFSEVKMKTLLNRSTARVIVSTLAILLLLAASAPLPVAAQGISKIGLTSESEAPGGEPSVNEPVLVYETVFSGAFLDYGRDIAVDTAGNAYVLAYAYDSGHDVLVAKLAPDGSLLYTVYLGGSALDIGTGIAVDDQGFVYVTGWTDSADFPTLDPIQATKNGPRDAFVTRLSGQDGSIVFSTYFGGSRADATNDIALTGAGEILLTGYTDSTDFPTLNPIQPNLNTSQCFCEDAFVTRLSADGSTLLYSTYLGGAFTDWGMSIAADAGGNIFVAGDTKSGDFPIQNPIQPSFAGGMRDVFVTRISSDGSAIDYSTFLGGEDWDRVGRIAVDTAGNAYISGSTRSVSFPTTAGAFQEQFAGGILACGQPPFDPLHNCDDVFVTRIAPDGSALDFSTFIGGTLEEEGHSVAVDSDGQVYIVGHTNSTDFPPSGFGFGAGIFLSQLSADGSALNYTIPIQSGSYNQGHGVVVDGAGDIYLTGAKNVPSDVYVARFSAPQQPALHVARIDLEFKGPGLSAKAETNKPLSLDAEVEINDQNGGAVAGADVTVRITDPDGLYREFTHATDENGAALFSNWDPLEGEGVWEVCVLSVVKDGAAYDPSQNVETCDIIKGPQ